MQTTDNSSSPKASRIPRLIEHLPSQESQPIVSDIVNVSVRIYFIAILKRNNNKKNINQNFILQTKLDPDISSAESENDDNNDSLNASGDEEEDDDDGPEEAQPVEILKPRIR